MSGARDLMTPEQPVARARAVGARADRGGRAAEDVRLRGASRMETRRRDRDPGPRPSPRAHRAGLGRRGRRGPARRRRPVAPQVVARVGTAARAGPARRLGGLALGRAGVVLLGGVVTRDHRAHAARTAPARRRTAGAQCRGEKPRARPRHDTDRTGRHDGAPATGHRSHRPRPVRRRRPGRACPGRQHRRAGPLDRVGGSAHGSPRPAGIPGHRGVGGGAGGMAGGGRESSGRLGPGAAAGRRGRARRARRRLPGGECAHLQRGRGAARTSRPRGRPVHPRVARAARRSGGERAGLRTVAPPAHKERAGWPALERVDRRGADPRTGMFSEEFVRLARSVLGDDTAVARGPLVCVYNRTGGARLLACRHCGELARCARCGAAAARPRDEEVLRCPRCGETRPVVCVACGRLRMKMLRPGVSRLREELAALLGVEVGEVTGPGAGARRRCERAGAPGGARARRHRGRAAPGPPRRRSGILGHRSAPAGAPALRHRGHPGALRARRLG